jgi:hypothetical protein
MDLSLTSIAIFYIGLILFAGFKLSKYLSRESRPQKMRIYALTGGSLIFGSIVIFFADTYARVTVAQASFSIALSDCLHYLIIQPIGTSLLLLPFVVAGFLSAIEAKDKKISHALIILACGLLLIIFFYINGYVSSQKALLDRAWTASALSIGLMPFISLPFSILIIFGTSYALNYLKQRMS